MSGGVPSRIRVLVVDDSITVRRFLVDVVSAQPDMEVVGEAGNGEEAFRACCRLLPDVVTLDVMMPVQSGLEATERIMGWCPRPIVIVSSSQERGGILQSFDALAAGALEVLEKPRADDPGWERTFVDTLRLVSRIRVVTHPRGRIGARAPLDVPADATARHRARLVALGASTGGPQALAELLGSLPRSFSLPILLVVHIGAAFSRAFVDWLAELSPLPVRLARDGEELPRDGVVLVGAPERHLEVHGERVRTTVGPERHSCIPSVDVLFESVARSHGAAAIGCLLTGMGRDGAAGLLAIRRRGGLTIAQDEATSVIFGMPREAIELGAAELVLPLPRIGPTLAERERTP